MLRISHVFSLFLMAYTLILPALSGEGTLIQAFKNTIKPTLSVEKWRSYRAAKKEKQEWPLKKFMPIITPALNKVMSDKLRSLRKAQSESRAATAQTRRNQMTSIALENISLRLREAEAEYATAMKGYGILARWGKQHRTLLMQHADTDIERWAEAYLRLQCSLAGMRAHPTHNNSRIAEEALHTHNTTRNLPRALQVH